MKRKSRILKTGSPSHCGIFPSPWIVIAAAVILLVVVVTLAVRNINREKQHMSQILSEKGGALIKAFEAGARTGMMGMMWGGNQVQRLLEELRLNPDTPGGEYLFPLCSGSRASLLDYLGPDSLLIAVDSEGLTAGCEVLRREYLELYRKSRSEGKSAGAEKPPPRRILLDYTTLESAFGRTVHLHSLKGKREEGARIAMGCDPPRSFFGNLAFLKEELENQAASTRAMLPRWASTAGDGSGSVFP